MFHSGISIGLKHFQCCNLLNGGKAILCQKFVHTFHMQLRLGSFISDKSSILVKKKVIVFPNIFAANMKCSNVLSRNIWLLTNDVMMTSLVNA